MSISGTLARASIGKYFLAASKSGIIPCCRSASSTASQSAEIHSPGFSDSRKVDLKKPESLVKPQVRITQYFSPGSGQSKQLPQSQSTANSQSRSQTVQDNNKSRSAVLEIEDPLDDLNSQPPIAIALRDACKCHKCKDPSTSQRNFNIAHIPVNLKASELTQDAQGNWTIRWENDIPGWEDHVSTYTPQQLERLTQYMRGEHYVTTQLWDRKTLEKEKSSITYDKYMNSDTDLAQALSFFARHGVVFIRDVPEEEAAVKRMAQRIGVLKSTFYGETWDVRSVPDAKNVAYTSKYLGFHSDLLYTREPPTVQYLHCLQNSTNGGESRFVDQFKAFDVLASEDPDMAHTLSKTKLRYEYENDGFYYSDIKPIVQNRSSNYQFPKRWVMGSKNGHPKWIYRMFWSPPFLGSIISDNGQAMHGVTELKAMNRYAEILERDDLVFEEKMEPGTCVMFDNLRVLHARNEFDVNSGSRWLRGAYLDGEVLWSKEMQLRNQMASFDLSRDENHRTQPET